MVLVLNKRAFLDLSMTFSRPSHSGHLLMSACHPVVIIAQYQTVSSWLGYLRAAESVLNNNKTTDEAIIIFFGSEEARNTFCSEGSLERAVFGAKAVLGLPETSPLSASSSSLPFTGYQCTVTQLLRVSVSVSTTVTKASCNLHTFEKNKWKLVQSTDCFFSVRTEHRWKEVAVVTLNLEIVNNPICFNTRSCSWCMWLYRNHPITGSVINSADNYVLDILSIMYNTHNNCY